MPVGSATLQAFASRFRGCCIGHAQVFFYICFLNNTFICALLFLGAGSVLCAPRSCHACATDVLPP